MLGVGAFQYHTLPAAHVFFAAIFFSSASVYVVLQARFDSTLHARGWLPRPVYPRNLYFRRVTAYAAMFSAVCMVGFIATGLTLGAAIAEIITACFLLTFFPLQHSLFEGMSVVCDISEEKNTVLQTVVENPISEQSGA
jgi:hypothetical protein